MQVLTRSIARSVARKTVHDLHGERFSDSGEGGIPRNRPLRGKSGAGAALTALRCPCDSFDGIRGVVYSETFFVIGCFDVDRSLKNLLTTRLIHFP